MAQSQFQGSVLRWLNRGDVSSWGRDPLAFDPAAARRVVGALDVCFGHGQPWEVSVEGLERLPDAPVMLVSNHSGGTVIPDAWGLAWAWYRHFGPSRPLHFLAHEWVLGFKPLGRALNRLGVVWAARDVARSVLRDARRDLVVFPGGDLDTWRPYRDRYRVEFGGRTGYAKLALELGVPIVPVAHAGAHETLRVIADGRRLAHWLKLSRLARANVFPVHFSLPWGLAIGPLPHLPWPANMRYQVGTALLPDAAAVGHPGGADVAALDEQVRAAVQKQLDRFATSPRRARA